MTTSTPAVMRAAVLHAARDLRIEDRPLPAAGPGEVLLQVTAAGICGSDASFFVEGIEAFPPEKRGAWPIVPGHEFAGRVVAIGEGVDGFALGELVACGAGISCGACRACRAGRTNLCEQYRTLGAHIDGGLAQYCVVPASTCVSAEAHGVTGDDAGLAQPMAVAVHAITRGGVAAGDRVLIIGAGGVGAFAVWAAHRRGAHVSATDRTASRLTIAAALGADATFDAADAGAAADEGWDVIVDTSGAAPALELALAGARPGTRIVQLGLHHEPRSLPLKRMTLNEIDLLGTYAHVCAADLPVALQLLAARTEGWADICPEVTPLSRIVEDGLVPLIDGSTERIKALIDPFIDVPRPYRR
jgi:2-desacetyl-2-hydroxyethyl bacteriochlorophyllide A dehydrogenase